MKNTSKKALMIVVALMAVPALTTTVMAIGPFKALEVGNNENLEALGLGVVNHRGGEDGGTIYWTWTPTGEHWVRWEFQDPASQAKGLINNAIIAEYSGPPSGMFAYFAYLSSDELDNKWIYLSGDGLTYPGQYMGHGMLYWFTYGIALLGGKTPAEAAASAAAMVGEHPQGLFWKHDGIKEP